MSTTNGPSLESEAVAAASRILNVDPAALAANPLSMLSRLTDLVGAGLCPTSELILPVLFRLSGQPVSLQDQFHFSPLFRRQRPKEIVFKCGRQVGKSTSFALDGCLLSAMIPFFSTLYLTPLYEQIRRFSTLVVRPLIADSPVSQLWTGANIEKSVLQRTFRNGSRMMFSFANTSADRTRGLSTKRVCFDELQDMDFNIIDIVKEVMAADRVYGLTQFSGTPKTTDGPLEKVWKESSQAEWWIPCRNPACPTRDRVNGRPTYNIPSIEYHLEKMIGKLHKGISEACPAIVCWGCQKPIFSRDGFWFHRYPERMLQRAGYHIPQPIIPLHYSDPQKWADLLLKRHRSSPAVFANECLGESMDMGQKLISENELRAAACLDWENKPDDPDQKVLDRIDYYTHRVLAVDWGGGGEHGFSFTAVALLGRRPDGVIEVAWGKRILGNDHIADASEILHWFVKFKCHYLAHDYTGAGNLRETILLQAKIPTDMTFPVTYMGTGVQDMCVTVKPQAAHHRVEHRVDKAKSLAATIACIRTGAILFFKYDGDNKMVVSLIKEFLNLIENRPKLEVTRSGYRIINPGTGPDDFAQAVNIGSVCMWEMTGEYPDIARRASIELDPDVLPPEPTRLWDQEDEPGIGELVF